MYLITKNHWYTNENDKQISLMRFFVNIALNINQIDGVFFVVKISDSSQSTLELNFKTQEEAIIFTEDVIDKCFTLEEIITQYQIQTTERAKRSRSISNVRYRKQNKNTSKS